MKEYKVTWKRTITAKNKKQAYKMVFDELWSYVNMNRKIEELPFLMRIKKEV